VRSTQITLALLIATSGLAIGEEVDVSIESALTESVERSLIQLDVSVTGAAGLVSELTAEDFKLRLGPHVIPEFVVDRLCPTPSPDGTPSEEPPSGEQPERISESSSSPSYMFYFDQHHLTFAGRERSIRLARELIENLVPRGRVTIVSAGQELRTFAGLTDDRALLHAALDRLEEDPGQVDAFASGEAQRVDEVYGALELALDGTRLHLNHGSRSSREASLNGLTEEMEAQVLEKMPVVQAFASEASAVKGQRMGGSVTSARLVARSLQREEWWHTDRALRRFSATLSRVASYDSPKAVIYFADTVRANAGEHLTTLISGTADVIAKSSVTSATSYNVPAFDWIIEEASAYGIRLYTVQAEGLTNHARPSRPVHAINASYTSVGADPGAQRFTDTESSLRAFASETGGRAFLGATPVEKMVDGIEADLSCLYVLSFDPGGLPEDRMLRVKLEPQRSGVSFRSRAQLVVRSESARLTSRLLAAFAAPDDVKGDRALRGVVIPTGFVKGQYTALVQVTTPASMIVDPDWDIGLSVRTGHTEPQEASGRIALKGEDATVVFEALVQLRPGPWEITAVAHDARSDEIVTVQIAGEWPDPDVESELAGPIALLQPTRAAFLRDGALRRQGPLAIDQDEAVLADLPAALVGVVCRGSDESGAWAVERRLVGEGAVEFPEMKVTAEEKCAVISDLIPAGTMTAGVFRYEVRVLGEGDPAEVTVREFAALKRE